MCGIFGIVGEKEAANVTYLGLYALQHRGQESAGIMSTDGNKIYKVRRRTLVADAFSEESFASLKGDTAIGHVRYSTTGSNSTRNIQPLVAAGQFGELAVSHNGNLTNFEPLRKNLEEKGAIFQSTTDSEILLHLVAQERSPTLLDRLFAACTQLEGAFSLLFLDRRHLVAVRDPWGFRPLAMGKTKDGALVFSSESCAFDLIDATFERELAPGEIVCVNRDTLKIENRFLTGKKHSSCVFEHIYFARPDSTVFERSVYDMRTKLGEQLAKEHPVDADVVIPVPDSGVITALGYATALNLPFGMGLIRNHYVGRTFIEPKQSIRGFGVKVKLNPVPSVIANKKIAVIDDSIVRGTTSKKIIKMLKDAGAREVHMLISSPPFVSPCMYGIDTPNKEELIAAVKSNEDVRAYLGADSLKYLSLEGLQSLFGNLSYCYACFTGSYPTPVKLQALPVNAA